MEKEISTKVKKMIDKKIIATTDLEQDNVIEQACRNLGLEFFRGSSDDVLNRYYKCAKKFNVDNILRITSDCPLIDPEIVDRVIKKYQTKLELFKWPQKRSFIFRFGPPPGPPLWSPPAPIPVPLINFFQKKIRSFICP